MSHSLFHVCAEAPLSSLSLAVPLSSPICKENVAGFLSSTKRNHFSNPSWTCSAEHAWTSTISTPVSFSALIISHHLLSPVLTTVWMLNRKSLWLEGRAKVQCEMYVESELWFVYSHRSTLKHIIMLLLFACLYLYMAHDHWYFKA